MFSHFEFKKNAAFICEFCHLNAYHAIYISQVTCIINNTLYNILRFEIKNKRKKLVQLAAIVQLAVIVLTATIKSKKLALNKLNYSDKIRNEMR